MGLAKLKRVNFLQGFYVAIGLLGCFFLFMSSEAQAVDSGERIVRRAIEDHIAGFSEWEKVEVTSVRLEPGTDFSDTAFVQVTGEAHSRPLGRRNFQMLAKFGNNETSFRASAVVKAYERVFYLARSLSRGQPVKSEDIVEQDMDVSRIPKGAVSDPSELKGLVAARSIGVNTLLRRSYFKEVPEAKRGSRVLIVVDSGPVKVVVPGVLKEDAYKGRSVRVMNTMSRKEVVGWLVNAGTVKINF